MGRADIGTEYGAQLFRARDNQVLSVASVAPSTAC